MELQKGHEQKNRDWNYENNGVLELRGDDAQQSKQKELRVERQEEYKKYLSQVQEFAVFGVLTLSKLLTVVLGVSLMHTLCSAVHNFHMYCVE